MLKLTETVKLLIVNETSVIKGIECANRLDNK